MSSGRKAALDEAMKVVVKMLPGRPVVLLTTRAGRRSQRRCPRRESGRRATRRARWSPICSSGRSARSAIRSSRWRGAGNFTTTRASRPTPKALLVDVLSRFGYPDLAGKARDGGYDDERATVEQVEELRHDVGAETFDALTGNDPSKRGQA